MSKNICIRCIDILTQFYSFKEQCCRSEQFLRSYLEANVSNSVKYIMSFLRKHFGLQVNDIISNIGTYQKDLMLKIDLREKSSTSNKKSIFVY